MAPTDKPPQAFDVTGPGNPPGGPEFAREPAAPVGDPSIRGINFDEPHPSGGTSIPVRRPGEPIPPPIPTAPPVASPPPPPPVSPPPSPKGRPFGSHMFGRSHTPAPPPPPPHVPIPAKRGRSGKWLWLLIILLLAAGVYLAADAGAIRGGSHLPFHVFSKYKTKPVSTTTSATTSSVPTGFTLYKLTDAAVEFDAPTTWGAPTFAADPGYSKRGSSNPSDGTHTYLVSFVQNKNVQLAFTSGSLLPASKADSRWFDYLGWCVGTADHQYYLQRLLFTTTSGVDSPATIACDQGPLKNASAVDSSTIFAPKLKAADGSMLGDLYIKNWTGNSKDLVAARALDVNSGNASDIKTLLGTLQNL